MTLSPAWLITEEVRRQRVVAWEQQLGGAAEPLKGPVAVVASVGRFKTGKSTLLNGLLRGDLLPEAATAETGLVTHLRRAERSGLFTLRYREEITVHADTPEARELVLQLRGRFDVKAYPSPLGTVLRFAKVPRPETRRLNREQLRNFLSSPLFQHVLESVLVEVPAENWPLPRHFELVDTPGLFSRLAHHEESARTYLRAITPDLPPVLVWLLPHRGEGDGEIGVIGDLMSRVPDLATRLVVLRNVDELELTSLTTEYALGQLDANGRAVPTFPVCLRRVARDGAERRLVLDLIAAHAAPELRAHSEALDARVAAALQRELAAARLPETEEGHLRLGVAADRITRRLQDHALALDNDVVLSLLDHAAPPTPAACAQLGERLALEYNTAPFRVDTPAGAGFVSEADELHRLLEALIRKFLDAVDRQEAKRGAEVLLQQVSGGKLKVPVIGAFSAGKTTLLNRLLDTDLPVAAGPATAVVTEIMGGPEATATVYYRSEVELPLVRYSRAGFDATTWRLLVGDERECGARTLQAWLRTGDAEDIDLFTPDVSWLGRMRGRGDVSLRRLIEDGRLVPVDRAHRSELLDRMARQYPNTDEATILSKRLPVRAIARLRPPTIGAAPHARPLPISDRATRDALYTILRQPGVAPRVQRVELRLPNHRLDHLTLVDTPGTDSAYVHHRIATLDYARGCAVFLVVLNGKHPLSAEELELVAMLRAVSESRGATKVAERFFFVATQRARVIPETERPHVEKEYLTYLQVRFTGAPFFFVDSVASDERQRTRFEAMAGALSARMRVFAVNNLLLDASRQLLSLVSDEITHQERLRALTDPATLEAEAKRLDEGRSRLVELVNELETGRSAPFTIARQAADALLLLSAAETALSEQIAVVENPEDVQRLQEAFVAQLEELEQEVRRLARTRMAALYGEVRAQYSAATDEDIIFAVPPVPDAPPIFSSRRLVEAIDGVDLRRHLFSPSTWFRTEGRLTMARDHLRAGLDAWRAETETVLSAWLESVAFAPQRASLGDVVPKIDERRAALAAQSLDLHASLAQADGVLARVRPLLRQANEMIAQCQAR
jgi:GTPase SAR1 family protein